MGNRCIVFQDVVIMAATLEKLFYEKLAEMPSDVIKHPLTLGTLTFFYA